MDYERIYKIQNTITDIIVEIAGVESHNIDLSTKLSELEMDSLDEQELLAELEITFDKDIPDNVFQKWETVYDVCTYFK